MSIQTRLAYTLCMSLMAFTCYGQTNADTIMVHYETKNFDVAIFPPQKYPPPEGMVSKQFKPSKEDIDSAETYLRSDLKNTSPWPDPPVSYNLKKYRRQYFGYVDSATGHRMLYINCFWKSFKYYQDWLKEPVSISEGGGYYWAIKFDLVSKKLFDFWVHGRE